MGLIARLAAEVAAVVALLVSAGGPDGVDLALDSCSAPRQYPYPARPDDALAASMTLTLEHFNSAWTNEDDQSPNEERFEECMLPAYSSQVTGHAESTRFYLRDFQVIHRVNIFAGVEEASTFMAGIEERAAYSAANIELETTSHEIRPEGRPYGEMPFESTADETRAFRLTYQKQDDDGTIYEAFRDLVYLRVDRAVILVTLRGYNSEPFEDLLGRAAEAAIARARR